MNKHEETYYLIENYLNGELAGDTLLQFEQELSTNPEMATALELQQLTREITVQASNHDLRTKMNAGIKQYDQQQLQNKYIKYGIAVAIIALSIAGYFFFQSYNESANIIPVEPVDIETPAQVVVAIPTPTVKAPQWIDSVKTPTSKPLEPATPSKEPSTAKADSEVSTTPDVTVKEEKEPLSASAIAPATVEKKNPIKEMPIQETTKELPPVRKTTPTTFDCSKVKIGAKPTIDTACIGEANGGVSFADKPFSGGQSPYTVYYKNKAGETFKNLFAGYYNFSIKDQNGCTTDKEVEVPEKFCPKTNHTLNLAFESAIMLYESVGVMATLKVYNKNGDLVYEISSVDEIKWDGNNNNGIEQPTGLYYYTISTETKTTKGEITILN